MSRGKHSSKARSALGFSLWVVVLALVLLTVAPRSATSRIEGEMVSDIWLDPTEPEQLFGPRSSVRWTADYVDGEIEDLPGRIREILFWPNTRLAETGLALSGGLEAGLVDETIFGLSLDGYLAREFGPDYPIGTMGGSTSVNMGQSDLDYWVNKGVINYGGFSYSGIFLLERGPVEGVYGSGFELSVTGTKISGLTLELKARFGMTPDLLELSGLVDGSGYDTFTPTGDRIQGYEGSEIVLEGINLGSARLDSTTRFSSDNGFEKTTIGFKLEEVSELLTLDGSVEFTPEEKSVSLIPQLELDSVCFDLYSRLDPSKLTEGSGTITGLVVEGYGLEDIQLGDVAISMLQALGGAKISRPAGGDDFELRASDYTFPLPDQKVYYDETEYGGVASLVGGTGNLYLASDFYWNGGSELFGLDTITGEAEYKVSESFELSTGLVFDLADGLQNIILNTVYRW